MLTVKIRTASNASFAFEYRTGASCVSVYARKLIGCKIDGHSECDAREEGLLLRGKPDKRLTWEVTYKEAAREREDWREFDVALMDGLDPKEKW